jgi:hypothetical protein
VILSGVAADVVLLGPRLRGPESSAPNHPALRWIAGEMWWAAHRRNPLTGKAACGAPGELVLASRGVPLCLACFPPPP